MVGLLFCEMFCRALNSVWEMGVEGVLCAFFAKKSSGTFA